MCSFLVGGIVNIQQKYRRNSQDNRDKQRIYQRTLQLAAEKRTQPVSRKADQNAEIRGI